MKGTLPSKHLKIPFVMNTIRMSQQYMYIFYLCFSFSVNGISFCQEGSKLSQDILIVLYLQGFSFSVNSISFCQEGSKLSQDILIVLYLQGFSFSVNGISFCQEGSKLSQRISVF